MLCHLLSLDSYFSNQKPLIHIRSEAKVLVKGIRKTENCSAPV